MRRENKRILLAALCLILAGGAVNCSGREETERVLESVEIIEGTAETAQTPQLRPAQTAPKVDGFCAVDIVLGDTVEYAYQNEDGLYLDPASLLRAMGFQAEIKQDGDGGVSICVPEKFDLYAVEGDGYLQVNGRYLYIPQGFLISNERVFFSQEAIERMFGVLLPSGVEREHLTVDAEKLNVLEGGAHYYDVTFSVDDLYWLSHIIEAEAGNQPIECMIGVGNVVINRTHANNYPDTIFQVVFDYQNAAQFTPKTSTALSRTVSDRAWVATCLCLEGYMTAEGCLYFQNPWGIETDWMTYAREYALTLGDMDFYY